MIGLCFLGSDSANELAVCDIFHSIFGYVMLMDELNGVGQIFNAFSHPIGFVQIHLPKTGSMHLGTWCFASAGNDSAAFQCLHP
jgi:hypothetical protein